MHVGDALSLATDAGLTDDDVYYYIRWRLKLKGGTENMGVCTKERKGVRDRLFPQTWM